MSKDYYEILGVSRDVSDAELKSAFRKLAHQHHPDKKGGDEAKFKEINEAYQVLSNKDKRAQYDQFGQNFDGSQGINWQDFARQTGGSNGFRTNINYEDMGFGDLGDMVGDLFGMGRRRSQRGQHGNDVQVELPLEFREAVFGVTKPMNLYKTIKCPSCSGNGAEPGTKIETCSACSGTGQVQRIQNTILGQMRTMGVCSDCNGEGKKVSQKCKKCKGQGTVKDYDDLDVKIPAGIADGQTIRIMGRGEAGSQGGSAGDLYIRVKVKEDPEFKREGDDIILDIEIPYSVAVLGGKADINTLDGSVKLKIPSGTPSGKVFKIRDRGIPHLKAGGRGDQLVTVKVKVPSKPSKKIKKILEELADEGE
ncbi:molecular chaperone DnaJ [Patescibacteria group bacterium]|nr:molecular chaperone DnaJ [Patescibacteria group bacterium]MBU1889942.1 molecular chaperone DnaJ [Patescibacteria group bacterium]